MDRILDSLIIQTQSVKSPAKSSFKYSGCSFFSRLGVSRLTRLIIWVIVGRHGYHVFKQLIMQRDQFGGAALYLGCQKQMQSLFQHITKFTYFDIERKLAKLYPPFASEFRVELKTTSHFVTPFLAAVSFRLARFLSRAIPHRHWRFPLGNLVLLVARRCDVAEQAISARAVASR